MLADILAHKYIGGPDMRMGEEEMAWVDAAAAEIGAARRVRQLPAVTGLAAEVDGFPQELVASRYERPPLELVRGLARSVRVLKVQLLSLTEQGLGAEFFAPDTSLQRLKSLLDDKLKELLAEAGTGELTAMQAVEQRQMLQQLQQEILNGLAPVVAALLAALDLARQKVMDPDGYSQESLRRDLGVLRRLDAPLVALEDSLYRLQRVHPGPDRAAFVQALVDLIQARQLAPVVRRNAALAIAKLGSAEAGHRTVILEALTDPDLSSRAACRWALHQMAIPTPSAL